MNREAIYETWRGKDHPWVAWVRPPLFEHVGDDDAAAAGAAPYRNESPPWGGLDTSWLPECAAIVIDLPGDDAVFLGLALGERGVRPVFAVNACSASEDLVPMQPVIRALTAGARFAGAFPTGRDVPPAFVLDARRDGEGRPVTPGCFDNRWALFAEDLPSAALLRDAGLTRVVLVQRGAEPLGDIEDIVRKYQAAGLDVLVRDAAAPGPLAPLALVPRGWFANVVSRVQRRLSVRRRWDGTFGRRVPLPPEPSHG